MIPTLLVFVFFLAATTVILSIRIFRAKKAIAELRTRGGLFESGDFTRDSRALVSSSIQNTRKLAVEGRKTASALSGQLERILGSTTNVRGNGARLASEARATAEGIESIASAFSEISVNTESLAKLIVKQAAELSQSTSSVAHISSSARSIAAEVEERKSSNERLSETTRAGAATAAATDRVIAEFAERASRMSDMVGVIDNIASSTNLLAMNAAIEAAHAGQYGKGFAVVADEIRKLASDTSEKAGEITSLLQSLTESIADARGAGTKTVRAFSDIDAIVSETIGSFDEMAKGIRELAQGSIELERSTKALDGITTEIKTGAKELTDASASINAGLQKSGDAARNSAQEIGNMEETLIDLNLGLLKLSDLNASCGSSSDSMVGALARLKTGGPDDDLKVGALDFATVRVRHKEWVSKVRLNIAGALEINPEEVASTKKCMLGKWLYEAGGKERMRGQKLLEDLEPLHERIHELVAHIIRDKRTLSPEERERKIVDLEALSTQLIDILNRMEKALVD